MVGLTGTPKTAEAVLRARKRDTLCMHPYGRSSQSRFSEANARPATSLIPKTSGGSDPLSDPLSADPGWLRIFARASFHTNLGFQGPNRRPSFWFKGHIRDASSGRVCGSRQDLAAICDRHVWRKHCRWSTLKSQKDALFCTLGLINISRWSV